MIIKLTGEYGNYVFVNPDYIASFNSVGRVTSLFMCNDTSPIRVLEEPEQIFNLINNTK